MIKIFSPSFFLISIIALMVLSGCSSKPQKNNEPILHQTIEQRNSALLEKTSWKLSGKIAFIQPEERKSASMVWHKDENSQQVDLTSYLGINVLHLSSKDELHTIKVDGKAYQSTDLDGLIYNLTGITLPTKALSYWLKGIAYQANDQVFYDEQTLLPTELTSQYNGKLWLINYSKYKQFSHQQLASIITVTQDNLLIKIQIKQWSM